VLPQDGVHMDEFAHNFERIETQAEFESAAKQP
jgi:hypothetical protein